MSSQSEPLSRSTREYLPHGAAAAELSLVMGAFAMGTSEFTSMGLLPKIAHDLNVSLPVAGYMISVYALGVVVGAPLIAVLLAQTCRRVALVALLLLFALGNALTSLASGFGSLIVSRFIAGLPHGAYFGFACLVAASLADPSRRAQAIGRVMLGLSVANVLGVPLSTWIGQFGGWREAFGALSALGVGTAALCGLTLTRMPAAEGASPLSELAALGKPQVWLTLGIAAIGFGGMFAVYSYIAPALLFVTGVHESVVPLFLAVLGLGMMCGSFVGGWLADRGVMRAIGALLVLNLATYAAFHFSFHSLYAVALNLFVAGLGGVGLAPALQARLMDVAGNAQSLAASLNHSAFNIANALGAYVGGLSIEAGLGWTSTGPVGAAFAVGGLLVFWASIAHSRRHIQLPGSRPVRTALQ